MAEISAVSPPSPDPKAGKSRPKSETGFPYYDLDKCIEAVKVLHTQGGGRCSRAQFATLLGYSGVKNGGFLTRISACKMYGLVDETPAGVTLTDRAKKIIAPVRPSDAAQAKLDAFMTVDLFRQVFDDFDGHTLPAEVGLQNLVATKYGVVPNQVKPAVRNLLESAETAGLFALTGGRTKMVRPILNDVGPPVPEKEATKHEEPKDKGESPAAKSGGGGGAGGGDDEGIHPAFAALLRTFPPAATVVGPKRRAALIDAFRSTLNVIYPEPEDLA